MHIGTIFLIILIALLLIYWFICKCCIVVEQGTAVVIERFGRFLKICEAGFYPMIPFVDSPRPVIWREYEENKRCRGKYRDSFSPRMDLRQSIFDLPLQSIITRDNVEIIVHPMMMIQITDPVRVAYETYDIIEAVERLVQTSLRSVIGDMGLDDTLASREEIEKLVSNKVCKTCQDWGLTISGIDLLEIDPTNTIQTAMHEQIRAERYRRTQKVTAEGYAERVRLEAEGECQATKAAAQGDSESMKLISKGNSDARLVIAQKTMESLKTVADAMKGLNADPTQYLIGIQYIKTLVALASAGKSVEVYMPFQTDVGGLTSRL